MADVCECGNEPSGSVKCGEFLDYLETGLLLKKDSAPWSNYVYVLIFSTIFARNISQSKWNSVTYYHKCCCIQGSWRWDLVLYRADLL